MAISQDALGRANAASETTTRSAVFFAEYFPPYMGSDRRIFDLARSLKGWSIEFAVTPPLRILGGRCEDALKEYYQRHFVDGIIEDENGGIHGHYFILPPFLMAAWRTLGMVTAFGLTVPYLIARAVRHLRQRKPDVVVVAHPSYLCGLVGIIAARIAGLPVLLDYPDAWTPLAIETAGISARGMMSALLRRLECFIARRPDRIVSITRSLEIYIRALGFEGDIDIVANGADAGRFNATVESARSTLGYTGDDCVVLYSGRLEAWSGVHTIVEAISHVVRSQNRVKFLFVGDGSAANDLRENVRKMGLDGHVKILGFQNYGDMPRIIAAADVAIIPFPDTPTTRVCSPVKLFEFMLMQKPIITMDLPGIREAVDERHVVFIRDLSAGELARALSQLLNDPGRARGIAREGFDLCVSEYLLIDLANRFSANMEAVAFARR